MERNKVPVLKVFIPGGRNRHRYKKFKNVGDAVIRGDNFRDFGILNEGRSKDVKNNDGILAGWLSWSIILHIKKLWVYILVRAHI